MIIITSAPLGAAVLSELMRTSFGIKQAFTKTIFDFLELAWEKTLSNQIPHLNYRLALETR